MVKIKYFVWIDTFFVYFCRKYAAPRLNISNEFDDFALGLQYLCRKYAAPRLNISNEFDDFALGLQYFCRKELEMTAFPDKNK